MLVKHTCVHVILRMGCAGPCVDVNDISFYKITIMEIIFLVVNNTVSGFLLNSTYGIECKRTEA